MGLVKGYKYDVFISYAHLDNEKLTGETHGWIEHFFRDLSILLKRKLGERDISIWWDNRRIDGAQAFDDTIREGVTNSAVMVSLFSPSYAKSVYCNQELELFHQVASGSAVGFMIEDRPRLINVLLYNIHHSKWPQALAGRTGIPFHTATDDEDTGDPLRLDSEKGREQLARLRDSIVKLISRMSVIASEKEEKAAGEDMVTDNNFSVYFGEVADDLRLPKNLAVKELRKKGYNILPAIPSPDEILTLEEHDAKCLDVLNQANLSIHLLSKFPGQEIGDGEHGWYSKRQTELALEHARSQLLWVPADINKLVVEPEPYKDFIVGLENHRSNASQFDFISGSRSTIVRDIVSFAEAARVQPSRSNGRLSVLLDTHYDDQVYAWDMSRNLYQHEVQPFINPEEGDPRKNINMLADRISKVNNLIFFCGRVSRDWLLERINAAMQLIVSHNYPVQGLFVVYVPPNKGIEQVTLNQKRFVIDVLDFTQGSDENNRAFKTLVKQLKRGRS